MTKKITLFISLVISVVITKGQCDPDIEPPIVFSIFEDQTIDADANCMALMPDYTNTVDAIDNCSVFVTVIQIPFPFSPISGESNLVTLEVWDEEFNTTYVNFNVSVEDNTAPVPDVATLDDITAECEVTSLTAPTATDNCVGSIEGTHNAIFPITGEGTTTVVTWTYDDGNGNTTTQT